MEEKCEVKNGKCGIKVKLTELAKLPQKAFPSDAGWDLFSLERIKIPAGRVITIKTGVYLEMPSGWFGLILDKSSLGLRGVKVFGGVIDSDYRGEILVVLGNLGVEEIFIGHGRKIAQIVFLQTPVIGLEIVEQLSDSDRGRGGFGSSGK